MATDERIRRGENISSSALTLYTSPTGTNTQSKITTATAFASARDVLNIHFVPSGDSAGSGNKVYEGAIAAGRNKILPFSGKKLSGGYSIVVYAETGGRINVVFDVEEVSP